MSNLEAALQDSIAANQQLTAVVNGKIGEIDSKVAQAQADVNGFIAGARGEQSHFRLTKNQLLTGITGAPPTGWLAHPGCSFEIVESVNDGVEWANRSPLAQEFLTAAGMSGAKHLHRNFNIWRMKWTNSPSFSLHQLHTATQTVTNMAVCKLINGAITGWWATGAEVGVCKVTGQHAKYGGLGYIHNHPYPQSATGELLFALPAAVTGYVDLTDGKSFGFFPYIGDTQND